MAQGPGFGIREYRLGVGVSGFRDGVRWVLWDSVYYGLVLFRLFPSPQNKVPIHIRGSASRIGPTFAAEALPT